MQSRSKIAFSPEQQKGYRSLEKKVFIPENDSIRSQEADESQSHSFIWSCYVMSAQRNI
jgi:hypothetical protein